MTIFDVIDKAKAAGWETMLIRRMTPPIRGSGKVAYFFWGGLSVEWHEGEVRYCHGIDGDVATEDADPGTLWRMMRAAMELKEIEEVKP